MQEKLPSCPECHSDFTYQDGILFVCPNCSFEWGLNQNDNSNIEPKTKVFKDAHGNILNDGDSISVLKDLRIGSSSDVIKQGTKVKGIRLIESDNGHDIDCKIPGFGEIQLKSEFVKKI